MSTLALAQRRDSPDQSKLRIKSGYESGDASGCESDSPSVLNNEESVAALLTAARIQNEDLKAQVIELTEQIESIKGGKACKNCKNMEKDLYQQYMIRQSLEEQMEEIQDKAQRHEYLIKNESHNLQVERTLTEHLAKELALKEADLEELRRNFRDSEKTRVSQLSSTGPWTIEEKMNIIEEVKFDAGGIANYFGKTNGTCMSCVGLMTCTWIFTPFYFSCAKKSAVERANTIALSLTTEGILYHEARQHTRLRCACCDQKEMKIAIPYSNIEEVRVVAPSMKAGRCCVKQTLTRIQIHTFSYKGTPELTLWGVDEPDAFATKVREAMAKNGFSPEKKKKGAPMQQKMYSYGKQVQQM